MVKLPTTEEMLKAGVHFGHQAARWHPKMKPYIFGVKNNIHLLDLDKTLALLPTALEFMQGVVARGGKVLFVGTKRQAQAAVQAAAEACGMPFVTGRWLGGTITNFPQIRRSIRELKDLKDQRDKGELRKYTKKEQLLITRKIEEMSDKLGGIAGLEAIPEAMLAFDVRHEKTAIIEASMLGVKVVALCDSNVNPAPVNYVVPGNDDAVKSITMIANLASEAIKEGAAQFVTASAERKAALTKAAAPAAKA